ncbi:hypothetical protein ABT337_30435 [Saccharopolyspora hirsuta]|uniref:hypothetical protein n=1 Tax=Saccharopolyspora hirsuta TaxID=1837 RepID=UPI00331FF8CE
MSLLGYSTSTNMCRAATCRSTKMSTTLCTGPYGTLPPEIASTSAFVRAFIHGSRTARTPAEFLLHSDFATNRSYRATSQAKPLVDDAVTRGSQVQHDD